MTTTPPPAPIVFCDIESTGLGPEDEIWEFAAIRRDPDGTETDLHIFIEHDEQKCLRLPGEFREDHCARFPSACSNRVATRSDAASHILRFFRTDDDTPSVVVGINPAFDLGHLTRLIHTERPGRSLPWDYTPVDARHLAVGALAATPPKIMLGFDGTHDGPLVAASSQPLTGITHISPAGISHVPAVPGPPWRSEDVSRALGINPDDYARHTAMGDVRWAMAIYDAVTNPTRTEV